MNPRDGNHVKANLLTNNLKTRYINVRTGLQASLGAWYQTLEKTYLKWLPTLLKLIITTVLSEGLPPKSLLSKSEVILMANTAIYN